MTASASRVPVGKISRRSLLEIARGLYRTKGAGTAGGTEDTTTTTALQSPIPLHDQQKQQRPWRCFRLKEHHFGSFGTPTLAPTPENFHDLLCDRIRKAKRRVYLASLYIGPAVDSVKYDKEVELLDALRDISSSGRDGDNDNEVEIKILLDHNRALRPVPTGNKDMNTHTTSADACLQALQSSTQSSTQSSAKSKSNKNQSVHLFSVLSKHLQKVLPNPMNEVAGVFHLKLYIIDDELILSGANLSQEYFVDRCDRYLWIVQGGGGLVECYADLVKVLCQHAQEYVYKSSDHDDKDKILLPATKAPSSMTLLESIEQVLTQDAASAAAEDMNPDDDENDADSSNIHKTVAYAVPTFQAPAHFGIHPRLRSDVETFQDVLTAASSSARASSTAQQQTQQQTHVRLATAYLNPTDSILAACQGAAAVHLLTAGRVSHGFKPKTSQKAGNKGKDWIPTVFFQLAEKAAAKLENGIVNSDCYSHLWYYQRPDWTFHAKGIWLSGSGSGDKDNDHENDATDKTNANANDPRISDNTPLYMVTHGSGNFGARSEHRDMESNLLLFFPEKSPIQTKFVQEWNSFCEFAGSAETEPAAQPLAWHLRLALPYIRSFF
jgi:CDP-diacylglycerol--glycerol-3-phosphate 3-phosphatidyltransferase